MGTKKAGNPAFLCFYDPILLNHIRISDQAGLIGLHIAAADGGFHCSYQASSLRCTQVADITRGNMGQGCQNIVAIDGVEATALWTVSRDWHLENIVPHLWIN